MEIIDELENQKRGLYSGIVGYFSYSGNLDSCIAIRTIIVKDGTAYVQAGAGIVYDSDPAAEYPACLVALGATPELLQYDALLAFMRHGLVEVVAAGVVFVSLWSAAHRLRITCYDLGVRADTLVATLLYSAALAGTAAAALYLSRI